MAFQHEGYQVISILCHHQVVGDDALKRRTMQNLASSATRSLPSKDVTEETIDRIFIDFILYCNPHYPCDTDTSELKECLHSVPKSDGKNFTIHSLWKLVQKLETKEIQTWIRLALDLGVEPPTAENKASVQKVQQYTVRLKVGRSFSIFAALLNSVALDASTACRRILRISPG